jgi:small subunit ribosomal protein S6
MNIECNGEALDKLNYAINYNDAILRRLVIKKREAEYSESIMMKIKKSQKDDKNLL